MGLGVAKSGEGHIIQIQCSARPLVRKPELEQEWNETRRKQTRGRKEHLDLDLN